MKKTIIALHTVCILVMLISCSRTVKTSNTVGDWYQVTSKNMGGYNITARTKLTIIRIEAGKYTYQTETTMSDEMYGGFPKTENSSGRFEEAIKNNEWKFSGGDFGNRGAYIIVPDDQWDNYEPTNITVAFLSGSGNSMVFKRGVTNVQKSIPETSTVIDTPDTIKPTELPKAEVVQKSKYEMLQGKWQSVEDKAVFMVFDNNKWDNQEYVISDRCENDGNKENDLVKEKDRYISILGDDMCWYIIELNSSTLSLSYMGRGNTLNYKKVK